MHAVVAHKQNEKLTPRFMVKLAYYIILVNKLPETSTEANVPNGRI